MMEVGNRILLGREVLGEILTENGVLQLTLIDRPGSQGHRWWSRHSNNTALS